mmetsp:Transcript_51061/g.94446  ORF Transcript_51061/g.94446 Transcript_51061/m.94446 type:complete len:426 (+) Transcript_51061:65-1342(+)
MATVGRTSVLTSRTAGSTSVCFSQRSAAKPSFQGQGHVQQQDSITSSPAILHRDTPGDAPASAKTGRAGSKRQPATQDSSDRPQLVGGYWSKPRSSPTVTLREGRLSKSPVTRKGWHTGSLNVPISMMDDEGPRCSPRGSPRVSPKANLVPAMTPSTEDGFSVVSVADHMQMQMQIDTRFREQEEKLAAMISGLRSEFTGREAQRDVAAMVPGFNEQLTSIVELTVKSIVDNLREDLLDAQQQSMQLGIDDLRAELTQEVDLVQATTAGLREEYGRLDYEVARLVERQTTLQHSMEYAEQTRSTLKGDVAAVQAELGRIRDRSESAMRKSMTNVDELRHVLGGLEDQIRVHLKDGSAFLGTQSCPPLWQDPSTSQETPSSEFHGSPSGSAEPSSTSGRRLRRSWAPSPIQDPDAEKQAHHRFWMS